MNEQLERNQQTVTEFYDLMFKECPGAACGAAAITSATGIAMSTHLYPEMSAHLMCVTDTAHWLEWQDWADPILSEPLQLKDGHLVIPGKLGQGIEWEEKAVARYS